MFVFCAVLVVFEVSGSVRSGSGALRFGAKHTKRFVVFREGPVSDSNRPSCPGLWFWRPESDSDSRSNHIGPVVYSKSGYDQIMCFTV